MTNWLDTSFLEEDEKSCKRCGTPFSGKETLHITSDGNVVVKFVDCSACGLRLVLDVVRHEEIFPTDSAKRR